MIEKNPHENFYAPHRWYCITINPSDSYQKFQDPNRFDNFVKFMKTLFYEIYDCRAIAYVGNIEVSEPIKLIESKGPRLHYHGRMLFYDYKQIHQWLIHDLGKAARIGSVDIDTVGDLPTWDHYCRKQSMKTMPEKAELYNSYSLNNLQTVFASRYLMSVPEGAPQGEGVSGLVARADVIGGSDSDDKSETRRSVSDLDLDFEKIKNI